MIRPRSSFLLLVLFAHRACGGRMARCWLGLGLVCAAGAYSCSPAQAQQPTVKELARRLETGDRDARREAARELAERGKAAREALPQLIRGVRDRDPQIWHFSMMAIDRIGEEAAQAVDALVDQLSAYPPQRRYRASVALGHIGRPALAALQTALKSRDANVRAAAADALGVMESEAAPAVDRLARLLEDSEEAVRLAAAEALGKIGGPAVDAVKPMLVSSKPEVRAAAAAAVGFLGKVEPAISGSLAELAKDESPAVRAAALQALVKLHGVSAKHAPLFGDALFGEDETVRRAAFNAIAAARDVPDTLLVTMMRKAGTATEEVQRDVVFLLGRHASPRSGAVDALLRLAENKPALREPVLRSLVRMGSPAVPVLLEALREHPQSADLLADALAQIGGAARTALLHALRSDQEAVRASAVMALGRLPVDSRTRQSLIATLEDSSGLVRAAGVTALAAQVPQPDSALREMLLGRAGDGDPRVRSAVATALSGLESGRPEIRQAMARLLADSDVHVRRCALETLAGWPSLSEEIVAVLQQLAQRNDARTAGALLALAARHRSLLSGSEQAWRRVAEGATRGSSAEGRKAAAVFWGTLAARDQTAQGELARLIGDQDESVSLSALKAIPRLPEESDVLWRSVTGRIRQGSSAQRSAAIGSLDRLTRSVDKRKRILLELIGSDDWAVRAEACRALGEMGGQAKDAVPQLLKLLRSADDEQAARRALQQIGTAGPEAVPLLRELLRERNPRRRAYAVYLIGRVEPAPVEMLGELKKLRGNRGDERFRRLLESTIRRIEQAKSADGS